VRGVSRKDAVIYFVALGYAILFEFIILDKNGNKAGANSLLVTCPLKRDPIVKLGSQEVKNEQEEIFGRTNHQQASTSRGSAI